MKIEKIETKGRGVIEENFMNELAGKINELISVINEMSEGCEHESADRLKHYFCPDCGEPVFMEDKQKDEEKKSQWKLVGRKLYVQSMVPTERWIEVELTDEQLENFTVTIED